MTLKVLTKAKPKKSVAKKSSAGVKAVAVAATAVAVASVVKPKAKVKTPTKVAPKSKDARPPKIKKPAKPDDLKLISGVGPKLEGILNGLGIYKFEQVSKWKKAERDWVDGYLKFKGRIDRDNWVAQAKKLAKAK